MERLELLYLLRNLAEQEQIVRDLPSAPEHYSFSSAFMFHILREELHLNPGAQRDPQPTKIAKEWHARIAQVLQQRLPRTSQLILEIALNYFRAGPGYENQAVDFCLAAAEIGVRSRRMREAQEWLERARQAAQAGRIPLDPKRISELSTSIQPSEPNSRNQSDRSAKLEKSQVQSSANLFIEN